MQVPALIYGLYPEVGRGIRRMVTQMSRGASLEEAIGANCLIDSDEPEGLFSLNYPSRPLGGRPHFHIILPLLGIWGAMVNGRLAWASEEPIFNTCLGNAWGVLLLLPHSLSCWLKEEHRWVPFMRAAARFWPILEAVGIRYTYGSALVTPLENTVTSLDYVLYNSGIYTGDPNPLRPPDWPALVEAYAERRARQLH